VNQTLNTNIISIHPAQALQNDMIILTSKRAGISNKTGKNH